MGERNHPSSHGCLGYPVGIDGYPILTYKFLTSVPSYRQLRLIARNATGVLARRTELFAYAVEYDADVILLTKTHLAPRSRFSLPSASPLVTENHLYDQNLHQNVCCVSSPVDSAIIFDDVDLQVTQLQELRQLGRYIVLVCNESSVFPSEVLHAIHL